MSKTFHNLIAAGFGGQGIMLLGQIVAYSGMKEGLFVTWIPSYGPEMRGGTANCSVVLSNEEVGSPVVSSADVVIIMNQPSLPKYEPKLKTAGSLIYNSDIVAYDNPRNDINIYPIPCNSKAMELGNEKIANMVALGAFAYATGWINDKSYDETLAYVFGTKKAALLDINLKAFKNGKELASQIRPAKD